MGWFWRKKKPDGRDNAEQLNSGTSSDYSTTHTYDYSADSGGVSSDAATGDTDTGSCSDAGGDSGGCDGGGGDAF